MTTVIVITYQDVDGKDGRETIRVSHGIDMDTLETVILPDVLLGGLGAKFDGELGEYVLKY